MTSSDSELDFEEVSNANSEQLYCSSSSFDEDDSDLEPDEIRGMEPYQFEPELADDEPAVRGRVQAAKTTRPATSLFLAICLLPPSVTGAHVSGCLNVAW